MNKRSVHNLTGNQIYNLCGTVKTTIQVRRDTTANWTANKDTVPFAGELCFDLDTGILKIGDGVTTYENLEPIGGLNAAHWVIDPAFIEQKRPERKVKKEEELSAGDTRLLDEFLNGFIKNGS